MVNPTPQKTAFVKPTSSLGQFQNQNLGAISTGIGTQVQSPASAGLGIGAYQRMNAGKPRERAMQGLDTIRGTAGRQHDLRMAAIRRNLQNRMSSVGPSIVGGRLGSGPGTNFAAGQGLVGPWKLLPDVDASFRAMNEAYRQVFGQDLIVNDGGRTREEQAYLYNLYLQGRGNLAAPPGHSLHESGRALDLGGPITNASSREHRWLQANAHRWGFYWAGKNFSQIEPWHWERNG